MKRDVLRAGRQTLTLSIANTNRVLALPGITFSSLLLVDGRSSRRLSRSPIPGGISFENFEMVAPFRDGQESCRCQATGRSAMMLMLAKLVYLVSKPIQVVTESIDFVLQPADNLVSLFDVLLFLGFLADLFGLALEMFGRFVHVGLA
jgi:hypothetical protein